jgi:tetratricopeptide (TPR) repeat protein
MWLRLGTGGLALLILILLYSRWQLLQSPARLKTRALAAARSGDWATALKAWRAFNATVYAQATTHLSEARACLALGLAAQAERSLLSATTADPTDPEAWRLLLQIYQVEDRTLEAQSLGWKAYARVRPDGKRELLRDLTLALLADVPDGRARAILQRWVDADAKDIDAQVALMQRIAAQRRTSDPDQATVIAVLESIVASYPDHTGAREALVIALADAGEPVRGRMVLDGWPAAMQDARYWRLQGRWNLEYEHRPANAVTSLDTALKAIPQDWRSWFRLARALHILGRHADSLRAAETVNRIREALDPLSLGPRLDAAIRHLNEPAALNDLATLCDRAGLTHLADAWRLQAP